MINIQCDILFVKYSLGAPSFGQMANTSGTSTSGAAPFGGGSSGGELIFNLFEL